MPASATRAGRLWAEAPAVGRSRNSCDAATNDRPYFRAQNLTDAARIACATGDVLLAERLRDGVVTAAERDRLSDESARAIIAETRGDAEGALLVYDAAADGWRDLGCVLEHGLALLGAARRRLGLGRADESASRLQRAREIFVQLEAQPLLLETDELLGTQRRATAR